MERIADPTLAETIAVERPADSLAASSSISQITSSAEAEEGRFIPGTLLGGRYRIIGLLGRGGMGEVYRATDLALGQSVALKFLPEEATQNPRLLERFHGEVRVARQVSHPNVCRVYDIGQAEGMPFISMEYVDGEDLSSLLLRIGRLPCDKAIETARKICAGLAAAHDRGIIHRDLKPCNIMMNKRGDVVIMDFGLAAIADHLAGAEVRNGTPAYMAPEQLRGAEVTAKSDIFALGLVLYELFTGKRPYNGNTVKDLLRQEESAHLTSMTSIALDIDPAVEKAIRRCLEPDPLRRPSSALAVAAALPGGDPLAAALAAGETPSPEMVASAGKQEGMARKYSIPCLAVIVVCLCAAVALRDRYCAAMHTALDFPPEVLAHQARQLAVAFGYPKKPADSHLEMVNRNDLLNTLKDLPEPRKWDDWLASEAPIEADYRESPALLIADPYGYVTADNPPPTEPGMVHVALDGANRLRGFSAVPYRDAAELTPPVQPDAVFHAAGLDMAAFQEATPTRAPTGPADQVRSWKGPHPKIPNVQLTVNMASWKGRVTDVNIAYHWPNAAAAKPERSMASRLQGIVLVALALFGVLSMIVLARRNWKLGRTDRNGALRVAAAQFALGFVAWTGSVHAVPSDSMIGMFFSRAAIWLMFSGMIWLLYLALEPLIRARWPHSIVSWNRLVTDHWLDPHAGSDILIGATVGAAIWVAAEWSSGSGSGALGGLSAISSTLGARQWIAAHANTLDNALIFGLVVFFAICGLRRLLRKDIPAAIVAALFFTFANGEVFTSSNWKIEVPIYIVMFSLLVFVLLRFGLVSVMAAVFFINGFNGIALGSDWKTWYAPAGLANWLLLLSIAIFAFWRSLGSRELFGGEAETS